MRKLLPMRYTDFPLRHTSPFLEQVGRCEIPQKPEGSDPKIVLVCQEQFSGSSNCQRDYFLSPHVMLLHKEVECVPHQSNSWNIWLEQPCKGAVHKPVLNTANLIASLDFPSCHTWSTAGKLDHMEIYYSVSVDILAQVFSLYLGS